MKRHFVHAVGATLAVLVCLSILRRPGGGPDRGGRRRRPRRPGLFNDPFTFYYAIYLPNQQLQAMRPTPLDSSTTRWSPANTTPSRIDVASTIRSRRTPTPTIRSDPIHQQERLARPSRFSHDPSNLTAWGPRSTSIGSPSTIPIWRAAATRNRNANVGRPARGRRSEVAAAWAAVWAAAAGAAAWDGGMGMF